MRQPERRFHAYDETEFIGYWAIFASRDEERL